MEFSPHPRNGRHPGNSQPPGVASMQNDAHYRNLLEKLPAGAYTCDAEGLITYYNQHAVHLWGRAPALNNPVDRYCGSFKLYDTDGAPIAHDQCWMALALKNQQGYNGEAIIVERPDGERLPVLAHANPLYDEQGHLVGAVNVLVDISEQKRLETEGRRSEERFRAAMEGGLHAFFILRAERDAAGAIVDFVFEDLNRQGEALIGIERARALGGHLLELLPANREMGFFDKYRRVVETREPLVEEFGTCAAGHVDAWYWQQVVPVGDGIAITTADFTERKREQAAQEEQLRQMTLVHALSTKATRATSLEEVYDAALDAICAATRTERASILLFDDDQVIRFKAWRGLSDAYRAAVEGHSPWSPDQVDAVPITVEDVAQDASLGPYRDVILGEGIQALAFIPLVHEQRLLGKFMVYARAPRPFSASELRLTQTMANHVAFAIVRQRAEQALATSEERLRAILDASTAVIFVKDLEGRYTIVNRAWRALFGRSEQDSVGKTDLDFLPEATARTLRENDRQVLEAGTPLTFEETADVPGHGRVVYISIKFPVADAEGVVYGVGGIATDITELKGTQEALRASEEQYRQLSATLEQRVQERTRELNRANEQLALRNRELQDFAHVASHDLQEPLRKFRAFLGLLQTELAAPSETVQDYIRRMDTSAERMSNLIRELLTLSRVATRGMAFCQVDLGEVIGEVLADLEVRVHEAEATVAIDSVCTLDADPLQIRQLFQNLIGNALKFRRAGVPAVLRIHAAPVEGDTGETACRIVVEDNGIGFEEKYLDRIFAPFQRLHGRSAYDGTGMGLAICRRIVERHGGTITAQSVPGSGSRFVVTLPLRQPGEGA